MAVIFSGENPGLTLFKPGTEERTVAASYWRCVYSPHGEGNALLIWTDPEGSGLGEAARHAIYTDNPGVARLVTERFNRHFGGFSDLGFEKLEPRPARFFQDSDSRYYHHVGCTDGEGVINLNWWDVVDHQRVSRAGFELGGAKWDLTTLICPCNNATIVVDGRTSAGEVRTRTGSDGRPGSSAFLAFSETWAEPD